MYFATTCDFVGDASWDELSLGLYLGQSQAEHELGVFVTGEFVMHMPAFYADDNGATYEVSSWDNLIWSGLPEGLSLSNASGQIDGNTQACLTYTGTPYQAGTFNVTVTGELMVSVFQYTNLGGRILPLRSSWSSSPMLTGFWVAPTPTP